jgi:hypothetical protein
MMPFVRELNNLGSSSTGGFNNNRDFNARFHFGSDICLK